jgi:hypothetical protein
VSSLRVTILSLLLILAPFALPLHAQTIDDGVMLARRTLWVGDIYGHDSADEYWEGALKRFNGNVGTVTVQSNTWFANYGVTNRLNVLTLVPYVWTKTSQGELHSMQGVQDLTLAAKYSLLEFPTTRIGAVRAMAVASGAIPLTDYTPDFAPLSIGTASKRLAGRFTLDVHTEPGWFVTGTTSYTWRGDVSLDRPYFYTNGVLTFSDKIDMPNVFDFVASGGYRKRGVNAHFEWWQLRTLGGGDIIRQDAPFVSNRRNFSRLTGSLMAPVPMLEQLAFQVTYGYTVAGRNVGQMTTITAGLMYTLPFGGRP